MRWRVAHRTVGHGPLYQGRFKSFPVQNGKPLLTVLRYVEGNAVGAGLTARAEHWRWGSLWARMHGDDALEAILCRWPVKRPRDWTARVNAALSTKELDRLRVSVARSRPFGDEQWVKETARALGLEHTLRPEGRPRKSGN